ncbi:MAG: hypothetical protein Q8P88_02860 [Candidatus Jorgensenbacteria bacterium]|nr:hypothetical protein [Candidatus Jorgensenbacteria bacterium]
MATVRNFHEKLERDLVRVTAEIARRKEAAPEAPPREIVKQSLVAAVPPLPHPSEEKGSGPPSSAADESHLPSYLSEESPEVKAEVERLVTLALEEGLVPAVAAAAKRSPFVLDALHDALVDKLLPELEKRGII